MTKKRGITSPEIKPAKITKMDENKLVAAFAEFSKKMEDMQKSQEDFHQTLKKQTQKIDYNYAELQNGIKGMKNEIEEIKNSQKFISDQFDQHSSDTKALKEDTNALHSRVNAIEDAHNSVEARITHLETQIVDLQQDKYNSSLAIHGITFKPNEDILQIMDLILKHIGTQIPIGAITETFRGGFQNRGPIVIKFSTIKQKDIILTTKGKRTIFSDEIGLNDKHDKIGITHYLHTKRREIYQKSAILRNHGFLFVWCKNGRILARRDANSQIHSINTEEDINRLVALGDRYTAELLNRNAKQSAPMETDDHDASRPSRNTNDRNGN